MNYGFEYEFCNPGSGNEKGHVEAMVKYEYVRNNFLLPGLHVIDLDELNKELWEKAEKDRFRKHYQKDRLISDLFEEDRAAFLALPPKAYECVRYETLKADKYGYIKVDLNWYSTSPRYALKKVLIKISYNTVEILDEEHHLVVKHSRIYGQYRKSMKWQPYLNLMAKRPTALKYTSFYEQLPKALVIASEHGHPSVDAIKQVFYQLVNGHGIRNEIKPKMPLPTLPKATRGLEHYDQLHKGGDA